MTRILFVFFAMVLGSQARASDFPFPTYDLDCTQYDKPNGTIFYWNREIRLQFSSIESVDLTIGVGLAAHLPMTICRTDYEMRVREVSADIYHMNGKLTCLTGKDGDQNQCAREKSDATFEFNSKTMKLYFKSITLDCEWRPSHNRTVH